MNHRCVFTSLYLIPLLKHHFILFSEKNQVKETMKCVINASRKVLDKKHKQNLNMRAIKERVENMNGQQ